jgi:general secretion pathway protein G
MQSVIPSTRRFERAFTLIELLVVIIILAILAAVVVPRVIGHTEDARMSRAISDITTIEGQLETYKLQCGNYPTQDQGLQALVTNVDNNTKWNGPYVKNGLPNDPWGHPYVYKFPPEHGGDVDIFSSGPDGQAGTADDIGNWSIQSR